MKIHGDLKMCRPIDRRNEAEVASAMGLKYSLKVVKQSDECCYDFALTTADDRHRAIVEVKSRDIYWGQYPDIQVSHEKIARCLDTAARLGCPFLFVVKCETGIFEAQINTLNGLKTSLGGRRDRMHLRISTDVERLVHFPINLFKRIK